MSDNLRNFRIFRRVNRAEHGRGVDVFKSILHYEGETVIYHEEMVAF